jgi:transcriptional regulator with XRE-family HTH domain
MTSGEPASWDGRTGTAGGAAFGAALRALARERGMADDAAFATAAGVEPDALAAVCNGERRVSVAELARYARALRVRAVEFLQKTQLLSLSVYALGLDPLYFLPDGEIRKDARIYMREINPRHAVPERDMLVRNPTLKALMADAVLDELGKLEIELAYLLRAAIQQTGGSL